MAMDPKQLRETVRAAHDAMRAGMREFYDALVETGGSPEFKPLKKGRELGPLGHEQEEAEGEEFPRTKAEQVALGRLDAE